MISSHVRPTGAMQGASSVLVAGKPERRVFNRVLRPVIWLCILLACLGSSWFVFQITLVPQPHEFAADWGKARWIQATDVAANSPDAAPVAYYRYTLPFEALPDRVFITITANQVFTLYVNSAYVGSNTMDFVGGETPRSYMYDLDWALKTGINAIGVRVANVDEGSPLLRANIGVVLGNQTRYYPSGASGWQATMRAGLVHLPGMRHRYDWSDEDFDAEHWPDAGLVPQDQAQTLASGPLMINPRVYQQPAPKHWLGTGGGEESYLVRRVEIPAGVENAVIRVMAVGEAQIFINDHLLMKWNGQGNMQRTKVEEYYEEHEEPVAYHKGLALGVYDVTPYLHSGQNVLAVHVVVPGTTASKVGLEDFRGAMAMDMLIRAGGKELNPLASDQGWHASPRPADGWTRAEGAAAIWPAPLVLGRPGASQTIPLPDSYLDDYVSVQVLPPLVIVELVVLCSALVVAAWLLFGLLVLRRYYPTKRQALEAASLAFLPALALEAALITLSRQSQLPQPFPYTLQWGGLLVGVALFSACVLWWQVRRRIRRVDEGAMVEQQREAIQARRTREEVVPCSWYGRVWRWLRENWAFDLLMLVAIPLVCYGITYEPYWQDELTSYNAALNIMWHGYPAFISGVTYPKAELFSLHMAILMSIFGTKSLLVPRLPSVILFLTSLPLLYIFGSKLFNRTVAWLATAMLLLSPYALIWSHQARMYEQAQFMVIVVLFAFYYAIKHRDRARPIYLAMLALILAYFSHEEVFIILPAVIVCTLLATREGPYGIPSVLRKKHWWIATLIGAAIIVIQLTLVFGTHPPAVGTDQSMRPQIQPTLDNLPYYFHQLFMPPEMKNSRTVWVPAPVVMVVHSLLAVLGCGLAFVRKDRRARYCALFLLLSAGTLIFIFTMQADRYYYALWPVHFLMAAYGLWWLLRTIWGFARPHLRDFAGRERPALLVRILVRTTAALVCVAVLLIPVLPLTNYSLFASRVFGVPFRHHYADYDKTGRYMLAHMQKGDVVISIAPAVITLFYVGQVDHYYSYDRALFLYETDNQLRETTSGSHPLLNDSDVNAVLAKHARVWIITDNGGYQGGVQKNGRFTFPPPDFRMVYEAYGAAVYFRGSMP